MKNADSFGMIITIIILMLIITAFFVLGIVEALRQAQLM